ncbi:hypothetical protein D3C79_679670 [compost metagenome]
MAAGGRSTPRASIWAQKLCISTGSTIFTATEFWAVMAEMTEQPCTPRLCMLCKSAWMPAPPPESEPAMVQTMGLVLMLLPALA